MWRKLINYAQNQVSAKYFRRGAKSRLTNAPLISPLYTRLMYLCICMYLCKFHMIVSSMYVREVREQFCSLHPVHNICWVCNKRFATSAPSSFSLYVHPIISGVITYPEVVGLPSVNAVSGADDVVLVH